MQKEIKTVVTSRPHLGIVFGKVDSAESICPVKSEEPDRSIHRTPTMKQIQGYERHFQGPRGHHPLQPSALAPKEARDE